MSERHTTLRSMHDLGLAAWFGGSLMGAVGVNGVASKMKDATQRLPAASTGWARWRPINAAAIGSHLIGAAGELATESPRVFGQAGVARMSAIKTGLTAAALAVTGYSGMLGRKLERAGETPVDGATEPNHQTPQHVAATQRQMKMLQWMIPALTGALIIITAYAGEQQKPSQVFRGMLGRASGVMSMRRMGMMGRAGGMMKGGRKGMMAGMAGRKMQKAIVRRGMPALAGRMRVGAFRS
jgi:hypothetical protein